MPYPILQHISRDNCAIPHQKQALKSFAILSLQVSLDMKSIAAGPLRAQVLMSLRGAGGGGVVLTDIWRDNADTDLWLKGSVVTSVPGVRKRCMNHDP